MNLKNHFIYRPFPEYVLYGRLTYTTSANQYIYIYQNRFIPQRSELSDDIIIYITTANDDNSHTLNVIAYEVSN